jgi:hypothetical protein
MFAQTVPQAVSPELQVNPHVVPLHVEVPLAGGTQATQDVVPQELIDELLEQVVPQR